MFTTWDQVKDWIVDNNFPHWIFSTKPFGEDAKDNIKVIDSNQFTVSDFQDKLDMTEKYLRMYGDKLYGVGFKTPLNVQGGIICEVRLQNEAVAPAAGVGMTQMLGGYGSIGELRESITKEIRATIELENLKKREAEVERREKELDADRQSAMGAIIHYFAPIGQMMMQQKMGVPMRQVAGVDTDGPAHVQPMIPDAAPAEQLAQEPEQEQSPFTDEEADKLFELMARFKKVEPQYMELLEAVVTMAESGDSTYNMAKGFLVK